MYIKVKSKDEAADLSKLIKDGNWIVLYYAEWCGHCNEMKPEWDNVVKLLSDLGINNKTTKTQQPIIHVADVESKHIPELKHKPAIEGYPTIKMYNDGKEVAKYQDERVADKITTFAMNNSKLQPKANTTVNTTANTTVNTKELEINSKPVKHEKTISTFEPITVDSESTKTTKLSDKNTTKKITLLEIENDNKKNNRVVSEMNPPVNQLKMDNLFNNALLKVNNVKKIKKVSKKHKQGNNKRNGKRSDKGSDKTINYNTLKCEGIKKAKKCKQNPNCEYDYNTFACVNKNKNIIKPQPLPNLNNSKKTKINKQITKNKNKNKNNNKNNNKNKETKKILSELVKSFDRIGEEARKDAELLKDASKKL